MNVPGSKAGEGGKRKRKEYALPMLTVQNRRERRYKKVISKCDFSVIDLETVIPTPAIITRNVPTHTV